MLVFKLENSSEGLIDTDTPPPRSHAGLLSERVSVEPEAMHCYGGSR